MLRTRRARPLAAAGLTTGLTTGLLTVVSMLASGAAHADGAGADSSSTGATTAEGSDGEPSNGDAVASTDWGALTRSDARAPLASDGSWSAQSDLGSMYSLTAEYGIQQAWSRGITGKGVTVAVVDTGIAPVAGLDEDAKVINGPDLSFDGQAAGTRYVDGFGHGTHLAGIIAGHDPRWDSGNPSPTAFAGVAPEARLLNLRVGAGDGGADVSQVIAALDWVVQNRDRDGMNVRVISLAYGTASTQAWQVDPLARAVENAWRAGIVVVTAAGNDGRDTPSLLMPAVDPNVLAVGAVDSMGTATPSDDSVADFSNGGSAERRPDVLAPGRSIVSLRVPGSYADTMSPEGAVRGDDSGRYFRGSGTSQATAFVAGEAALLLQQRPALTPDQVKSLLMSTARPLTDADPAGGAGVTDVLAATEAAVPAVTSSGSAATGTGSLEASRGGEHVVDPTTGAVLSGEVDVLGSRWDAAAWAARSAEGSAWQQGTWNGRVWTGDAFATDGWAFAPWSGDTWGGIPWSTYSRTTVRWEAHSWRGDNWEAHSWRADSWLAHSWRSLF